MYIDFSLKKIFMMAFLFFILIGTVGSTFSYVGTHFGDLRLPNALGRLIEKQLLLVKYEIRYIFTDRGALSAALSLFESKAHADQTRAEAIPVLVYHELVDKSDGHNITVEQFADHMYALKEMGWQTVSLSELEEFLQDKKKLPKRSFLLTFDDGAKDSYYPVDPLLKVLGYKAVTFLIAEHSAGPGSYYYLSEGEVRNLLQSGRWEIGSHGYQSHDLMAINGEGDVGAELANRLWLKEENRVETLEEYTARAHEDLRTARAKLENAFGVKVHTLAFPFGEFGQLSVDEEVASVAQDAAKENYKLAFYQTWQGEGFSYNYPEEKDFYMVKRIEPLEDWSTETLVERLERGLPKEIPFTDFFEKEEGWFATWGKYELGAGSMYMQSEERETGNAVLFDGTGHLVDYSFKAVVESPNGTGILLWGRLKDIDNNAACNFGNGFVHVEEILNGERNVIQGSRSDEYKIPSGEFTVEILIEGREVTCLLDGKPLARSEFLDESLNRGGVGIKIWDSTPGLSSLIIKEVSLTPVIKDKTP